MIIVVMGVEGAGKTTVGSELARRLGIQFLDADKFHSPENIRKMAAGIPLTDADRLPWLQSLNNALRDAADKKQDCVLACSALKESYRKTLADGVDVKWIYLKASPEGLRKRLQNRLGHYANENLLASQLQILEEPQDAITVNADREVDPIVTETLSRLKQSKPGSPDARQ
jgi:gluconokinase